jgi:hypothetical protein
MRYSGMKPIAFTATSARQWAKLSPDVRRRIDKRLTEFATSGHGDVSVSKDGMVRGCASETGV